MAKEFDVAGSTLKEIAQSLLNAKVSARTIENVADTFIPLTDQEDIKASLQAISAHGREAANLLSAIYQRIAREAAKEG